MIAVVKNLGSFYICDDNELIIKEYRKVNSLLSKAYWIQNRDDETMLKAMLNSLNYAVFEQQSQCLVGYARVITDYASMYYLSDVFIDEQFRGKGLGTALVEYICLTDERIIALNGMLKTRDAQSLYQKFGFEQCNVSCMVQNRQ